MKQKTKINKFALLFTVILMDFLVGTEFDLFVPSFLELQHHFDVSAFWLEAILSVNFIGYCLSLLFVGDLADRYGRKSIILLGIIIFIIGSIFSLMTTSYNLFLIGRFLQGIGIAAPSILSFLIIADAYPIKEQQFLLAMLNGVMNVSVAIAPIVGSYITMHFHWQGNFIALLLVGLLTFLATFIFIPHYELHKTKETLVLHSYFSIFRSKPLMLLISCIFLVFIPYWIFVGMSPLLYIKDLGVSLSHFGYYQGLLALVFAIGSVLYGFVIKRKDYDQKKMLIVSIWILIISAIVTTFVTIIDSHNPLLITVAFIGQVIPSTILYPLCLNFIPQAKGRISSIIQGGRLIFAAIGLQMAGYFYQGSFQNIGIVISIFVCIAIISLFFVIKNRKLINKVHA